LRAGYEAIARTTAQDEEQQTYQRTLRGPAMAEGPAAENRRIERGELQKWAIKSMRFVPQNFNAVEQIGDYQEVSPFHADVQAPIVRFYEDAFEWEHMNYFLYSYHWARRASWRMRTAASAVDPLHQAFLEAGAARVIVPITPASRTRWRGFFILQTQRLRNLSESLHHPRRHPPRRPAMLSAIFGLSCSPTISPTLREVPVR
jgi:hypothetical protein